MPIFDKVRSVPDSGPDPIGQFRQETIGDRIDAAERARAAFGRWSNLIAAFQVVVLASFGLFAAQRAGAGLFMTVVGMVIAPLPALGLYVVSHHGPKVLYSASTSTSTEPSRAGLDPLTGGEPEPAGPWWKAPRNVVLVTMGLFGAVCLVGAGLMGLHHMSEIMEAVGQREPGSAVFGIDPAYLVPALVECLQVFCVAGVAVRTIELGRLRAEAPKVRQDELNTETALLDLTARLNAQSLAAHLDYEERHIEGGAALRRIEAMGVLEEERAAAAREFLVASARDRAEAEMELEKDRLDNELALKRLHYEVQNTQQVALLEAHRVAADRLKRDLIKAAKSGAELPAIGSSFAELGAGFGSSATSTPSSDDVTAPMPDPKAGSPLAVNGSGPVDNGAGSPGNGR